MVSLPSFVVLRTSFLFLTSVWLFWFSIFIVFGSSFFSWILFWSCLFKIHSAVFRFGIFQLDFFLELFVQNSFYRFQMGGNKKPVKDHDAPYGSRCRVWGEQALYDAMTPELLRAQIAGLQSSLDSLQKQAAHDNPHKEQPGQEDPASSPPLDGKAQGLEDLASNLAAANRTQPTNSNGAGNWSGHNITDLRSNGNVSTLAEQLLGMVLQRAPFLQQMVTGQSQPQANLFPFPQQTTGGQLPAWGTGRTDGAGANPVHHGAAGHQTQTGGTLKISYHCVIKHSAYAFLVLIKTTYHTKVTDIATFNNVSFVLKDRSWRNNCIGISCQNIFYPT